MRTILDLILSNWFVVVILYIVLSSIVKKLKTGGKGGQGVPQPQRRTPKDSMPPFGGDGSGWPGSAKPMPKAQPVQARPAAPGGVRPQLAEMEPRRSQLAPLPEDVAAASPASGQPSAAAAAFPFAKPRGSGESTAAAFGGLTPQDAARGVLWAEILGPPRAKRPFRR
ncbi:hypothetical protein NLX71_01570 [Paenibacillus sp. MZ04-78.2]|uniref:hypothetical protein n=1 Tax=Paenibacillus sp. MZ04-78.2 TaxID=2962034 RepID=UPI0020B8329F|nr:hypothetical protein [Paenibacillus sp. MZ04-78.2]MCP3772009.1 hypothetical protein [Paenibacillus sp. MZ04-78.2]